jgi:hypothetical protein
MIFIEIMLVYTQSQHAVVMSVCLILILIGNRFPALRGVGSGCEAGGGEFNV